MCVCVCFRCGRVCGGDSALSGCRGVRQQSGLLHLYLSFGIPADQRHQLQRWPTPTHMLLTQDSEPLWWTHISYWLSVSVSFQMLTSVRMKRSSAPPTEIVWTHRGPTCVCATADSPPTLTHLPVMVGCNTYTHTHMHMHWVLLKSKWSSLCYAHSLWSVELNKLHGLCSTFDWCYSTFFILIK